MPVTVKCPTYVPHIRGYPNRHEKSDIYLNELRTVVRNVIPDVKSLRNVCYTWVEQCGKVKQVC